MDEATWRRLSLAEQGYVMDGEEPLRVGLARDVRALVDALGEREQQLRELAIDHDEVLAQLVVEDRHREQAEAALGESRKREAALAEALIKCAEISGEDGEAVEAARSGAMRHPSVEVFAVEAVRQLRADYDEALASVGLPDQENTP